MATAVKKKSAKKKAPARRVARALAVYLYGISQPSRKKVQLHAEAVDGQAAIKALRLAGHDCWISRVDRNEFAERLAENMENLEWLATVGVRHQRAVADLAAKVEILPARFGTVFLSDDSLRDHVEGSRKSIQSVFKKITGSEEWGVKVFQSIQSERPAMIEAASGTDYLKRKAQSVMPHSKEGDPELDRFSQSLRDLSVDATAGGKASSGQPNLLWHGSFLVKRSRHEQFSDALKQFTAKHGQRYRVECSGPWPPYSFVGQNG
jgi:hypothetical protein